MSPSEESTSPVVARSGGLGRLAALGALTLVVIAIVYLLFLGGDGGSRYKLLFETGGQLVKGNEVLIGGQPVGSVDEVKLTDNGEAEISISVDRPLHEGTQAIIRATSLSGIANRYVSIEPGPDNAPELPDDSTITEVDTTTPVDLDQLFDTFTGPARKGLRDVIQGSAATYAGRGAEANETYKYLNPSLVATDQLLQELDRDENVLTDFLVNGASVVSSVAERRDDLAGLTSNTNQFLGAIAAQNQSFDQALEALPRALRQGNTTFHNLRATLDDLDPLVNTSKTATRNLAPFLRQLKPVVRKSVPVFHNLRLVVNKKGKKNDLTDAAKFLPQLQQNAASASAPTVSAMQKSEPTLSFLRPYGPELTAAVSKLDQITAYYDADGHYARVEPAGLGIFTLAGAASPFTLAPQAAGNLYNDYGAFGGPLRKIFRRCPGGATQAIGGSNPFSSPPFLGQPAGAPSTPAPPGDCTSTDVPPGP